MSEVIAKQQQELAGIITRYSEKDGVFQTDVPFLRFVRDSNALVPNHGMYTPSFCIVVQGEKEVLLGVERFQYCPSDYLISSVHLPVIAQITKATTDEPYLGYILEFTADQILEVIRDSNIEEGSKENATRGMYVSQIDPPLLDPVIRLARLMDHPNDIPLLAPLYTKEILYRVLQGKHGKALQQIAMVGSSAHQINDVILHLTNHFSRSLRIEELADIANMSVSTLHRHFKEVTAMSPIQFQKQLRLQEARRLLLTEAADATDVAFRVGYESPSQFSREYSRMYGLPPRQDVKRLKA